MANNQISQKKEKEKNKYVRIEICSWVSLLTETTYLWRKQFW